MGTLFYLIPKDRLKGSDNKLFKEEGVLYPNSRKKKDRHHGGYNMLFRKEADCYFVRRLLYCQFHKNLNEFNTPHCI